MCTGARPQRKPRACVTMFSHEAYVKETSTPHVRGNERTSNQPTSSGPPTGANMSISPSPSKSRSSKETMLEPGNASPLIDCGVIDGKNVPQNPELDTCIKLDATENNASNKRIANDNLR